MAQDVVHQRVQVAGVEDEVVGVLYGEIGVAVAAQVGHDDFKARSDQRPYVAPPDAFGLRVAVDQQERVAADALAQVREAHAVGHFRTMHPEGVAGRRVGLARAQVRHDLLV